MADGPAIGRTPTEADVRAMHTVYCAGGKARQMAPHVVYSEETCPHAGCSQRMQAIDFRLEAHGRDIHDPLVRAWWDDTGFVGRCPACRGWIHFTIRSKRDVDDEEAAQLPQLPDNWFEEATVL